ncbi:MAG: ATP-binding protein [Mycobacteriaceae bacterium]|nr:ATP-binding protein [Mycobacteriaceae bacterium]MBV9638673.1 ATP-binding protein [Mycobacteriaceae bacterium]
MIDSTPSAGVANAERFERIGITADAQNAARTREQFTDWLHRFFELDPVRASDVVLALNEALANSAEFAYLLATRPGTMDVAARYDADDARLTVVVSDNGLWRGTSVDSRTRGRGIPLMRALSDRATIETSSSGTRVCLEWRDVGAARSDTYRTCEK